ncbi:MAG: hypothetical protein NTW35_03335 [Candidatus Nomurabacteria bacterium]|nr:hypothetical protein [Candidatus Nomurabacteria bacterium]
MPVYRLNVPLTKQTKNYLFHSKAFLESVGRGDDNLLVIINYALRLFENYLDLLDGNIVVLGFSNMQRNTFSMEEVAKEMHKQALEIIPFTEISQDYADWLESIKIKTDAKDHSEVIIYAISYLAFLVEIIENNGDIFLGQNTKEGLALAHYVIDLFASYRPALMH